MLLGGDADRPRWQAVGVVWASGRVDHPAHPPLPSLLGLLTARPIPLGSSAASEEVGDQLLGAPSRWRRRPGWSPGGCTPPRVGDRAAVLAVLPGQPLAAVLEGSVLGRSVIVSLGVAQAGSGRPGQRPRRPGAGTVGAVGGAQERAGEHSAVGAAAPGPQQNGRTPPGARHSSGEAPGAAAGQPLPASAKAALGTCALQHQLAHWRTRSAPTVERRRPADRAQRP